jgi:hypothetical protein
VVLVTPHHHSAEVSHHRIHVATRDLISSTGSQLLDSSRWVGDYTYRLLLFLSDLEELRPRDLVPYFCSNPKSAYSVVRRLERMGVVRRVARGVYRVVGDAVRRLLRLPVRYIRGGARRSPARFANGTTPADPATVYAQSSTSLLPVYYKSTTSLLPVYRGSTAVDPAVAGRPRYLGLFLDNVRRYDPDGRYRQSPRHVLMRPRDLDPGWLVAYSEVTHVVGNSVLDGVVVVYTNAEDFRRFGGGAVRVEWRPPSGYVRRNGLASAVLLAREELVKAFRAMAVVLGEVLTGRRLFELYSWVGRLWGVV